MLTQKYCRDHWGQYQSLFDYPKETEYILWLFSKEAIYTTILPRMLQNRDKLWHIIKKSRLQGL